MAGKQFDRGQVQQCVDILDKYLQSGQSPQAFAQSNGMSYGKFRAWLSLEARWRAQLAGQTYVPRAQRSAPKASGFVRLHVSTEALAQTQALPKPPALSGTSAGSVQIVCTQGPRSVVLHWPSTAALECAQWLRAYLEPQA